MATTETPYADLERRALDDLATRTLMSADAAPAHVEAARARLMTPRIDASDARTLARTLDADCLDDLSGVLARFHARADERAAWYAAQAPADDNTDHTPESP